MCLIYVWNPRVARMEALEKRDTVTKLSLATKNGSRFLIPNVWVLRGLNFEALRCIKIKEFGVLVPLKAQNFLASRRSLEGSYTCRHVKIGLRPS